MATTKDIFEKMGITQDEAVQADKELLEKPRSDKRICLCGHSVSRHDTTLDRPVCTVGKMYCPCKRIQPVLTVEDTRPFIRKTEGASILHALTRGIASAADRGQEMEFIPEAWVCHKCEQSDVRLSPVPVSANGVPQTEATGYDALLCDECRKGH